MTKTIDTRKECPRCHANLDDSSPQFPGGTRRIAIYDRERDCTVAYRCPYCNGDWPRSLGEIIAVQELAPGTP